MKFTIDKRRLQDALSVTGKSIVRTTTIPILACYLFEVEGNSLNITAGSMDFFISQSLAITQVEGGINKAIPSVRLSNLIKELPNQDLTFEFEAEQVQITALSGKYVIPTEDGTDYPKMVVDSKIEFTTDLPTVAAGISKCLFACGVDDGKPALTGLYTAVQRGSITYAGCNGFMISTVTLDVDIDSEVELIIPAKILSVLEAAKSEKVNVVIGKRGIKMGLDDGVVMKSILIDANYPDYKSVIPNNCDKHAVVNTSELLGALRRVSQFSENGFGAVKLSFAEGKCQISATNSLMNETAEEEVTAEYDGDPMVIGVISKQMVSCLSKIDREEVDLWLQAPNRPMLIVEDSDSIANKTDLMLLMPCTI